MNTAEKIKELNRDTSILSRFEENFVHDNAARITKWGDETRFSDKQVALIDRIYKERLEEGKAPNSREG